MVLLIKALTSRASEGCSPQSSTALRSSGWECHNELELGDSAERSGPAPS